MATSEEQQYTALEGFHRIAAGSLTEVVRKAKEAWDRGEHAPVLIFEEETSEQIGVNFQGDAEEVLQRLPTTSETSRPSPDAPRGPGRPKLGVVAREVTLLPRHWEWLNEQPGGASVALRRLVEDARRANQGRDRIRKAQEATYRFMSAMAGNLPGFEEAARALFARNEERFQELVAAWPEDVRAHVTRLAQEAMQPDRDELPAA